MSFYQTHPDTCEADVEWMFYVYSDPFDSPDPMSRIYEGAAMTPLNAGSIHVHILELGVDAPVLTSMMAMSRGVGPDQDMPNAQLQREAVSVMLHAIANHVPGEMVHASEDEVDECPVDEDGNPIGDTGGDYYVARCRAGAAICWLVAKLKVYSSRNLP